MFLTKKEIVFFENLHFDQTFDKNCIFHETQYVSIHDMLLTTLRKHGSFGESDCALDCGIEKTSNLELWCVAQCFWENSVNLFNELIKYF